MEESKDKKKSYTGKLQLEKTFNAGQIKQSFSHGRTRSVSVEVKKKRTLSRKEQVLPFLTICVGKKELIGEVGGACF